jgi:hypothetical protein
MRGGSVSLRGVIDVRDLLAIQEVTTGSGWRIA